jgi:hypothetical protein
VGVCKRYDSMGVRESGAGGKDRAGGKIKRSWRPHSGNYKGIIARKCWLVKCFAVNGRIFALNGIFVHWMAEVPGNYRWTEFSSGTYGKRVVLTD